MTQINMARRRSSRSGRGRRGEASHMGGVFGRVTDRPEGGLERRTLSTRRRRRMHGLWSTYERWAASCVVARSPGANETLPILRAIQNASSTRHLSHHSRFNTYLRLGSATSSTPTRKVQSNTWLGSEMRSMMTQRVNRVAWTGWSGDTHPFFCALLIPHYFAILCI
jgi:hypothetical protein